jgi:hypothetical protein
LAHALILHAPTPVGSDIGAVAPETVRLLPLASTSALFATPNTPVE